jgi:ubiquinone/menaquinone biosynthesis C-methylase UbiE
MNIFDQYSTKYDAWYDRNRCAYLSELAALKKAIPRGGLGLEIGVGTGRFAPPLGIAVGIDPSKNMIRIAEQRGVDARLGFGERLPFKNSTFDYVAIIIALCFVQNPQKVLNESKRVLKGKGKLVLGIIDKDSSLGRFYKKKKSVFYKQANFFSVGEVTELLKAIGFDRFYYHQTLFKSPYELRSVEEVRKGFGKGAFAVIRAETTTKI